jgi:hypothetical protein
MMNCDSESFENDLEQFPMSAPRVRPRFEVETDLDADSIMERLRRRLPECPHCTGMSVGRHAELFVPERDRRVWSPWLSVTADDHAPGSLLRARFAPHPSVWTFYLFLAFGIGFGLLVGTTWGYAQWATDQTPWALASVPIVLVLGFLLFLVSQVGQKLGGSQMEDLRDALEELIR